MNTITLSEARLAIRKGTPLRFIAQLEIGEFCLKPAEGVQFYIGTDEIGKLTVFVWHLFTILSTDCKQDVDRRILSTQNTIRENLGVTHTKITESTNTSIGIPA